MSIDLDELERLAKVALPKSHDVTCTISTLGGCSCGIYHRHYTATDALHGALQPGSVIVLVAELRAARVLCDLVERKQCCEGDETTTTKEGKDAVEAWRRAQRGES